MNRSANIIDTKVLSNNRFLLKEVTVNYTGLDGEIHSTKREVYERGDAASAALYNQQTGKVILINQFRLPTFLNGNPGGMLKEVCAGMLDGDTPETCVRREIMEETGYKIDAVAAAGEIYVSPAGCTERIYLFTAPYTADMRTSSGGGLVEEQEYIEIEEIPFEEALQLIARGEIRDAKTIVLLYHLRIQGLM
ncbi:NUDIX domain-containing protein [Cytophaga aurantiaca]|uniref:NUDIX domain-containing protein n=1 Tax=Cytophaga aurantiaca TaxID=29530 RepID=UPI00036998FA|nr:NUDIX domain-containing protein [Cytophaga aurantiaca]